MLSTFSRSRTLIFTCLSFWSNDFRSYMSTSLLEDLKSLNYIAGINFCLGVFGYLFLLLCAVSLKLSLESDDGLYELCEYSFVSVNFGVNLILSFGRLRFGLGDIRCSIAFDCILCWLSCESDSSIIFRLNCWSIIFSMEEFYLVSPLLVFLFSFP